MEQMQLHAVMIIMVYGIQQIPVKYGYKAV